MTIPNEVLGIIGVLLGLVVPILTSIFGYRQAMKQIAASKEEKQEDDETKRLEILAGLPEESAKAFDTGSRALREVIQFLDERDKQNQARIASLLQDIADRDAKSSQEREKFTIEIVSLRMEVKALSARVEEQSHGIGLLTAQIEEYGKTPRYVRRKTGPLADST